MLIADQISARLGMVSREIEQHPNAIEKFDKKLSELKTEYANIFH